MVDMSGNSMRSHYLYNACMTLSPFTVLVTSPRHAPFPSITPPHSQSTNCRPVPSHALNFYSLQPPPPHPSNYPIQSCRYNNNPPPLPHFYSDNCLISLHHVSCTTQSRTVSLRYTLHLFNRLESFVQRRGWMKGGRREGRK